MNQSTRSPTPREVFAWAVADTARSAKAAGLMAPSVVATADTVDRTRRSRYNSPSFVGAFHVDGSDAEAIAARRNDTASSKLAGVEWMARDETCVEAWTPGADARQQPPQLAAVVRFDTVGIAISVGMQESGELDRATSADARVVFDPSGNTTISVEFEGLGYVASDIARLRLAHMTAALELAESLATLRAELAGEHEQESGNPGIQVVADAVEAVGFTVLPK